MDTQNSNVEVAKSYSIFYWINAVIISAIVGAFTAGIAILVMMPISIWYKKAVVNRTKIIFENDTNKVVFQRGRWFVKDDDVIPVKAIDNVKLNRSLTGKIFGWCDLALETRSENYKLKFVSTKGAENFREKFLAQA